MGNERAAANEAAAAAASTGDLEATILADLILAVLDAGEGYAGRAVGRARGALHARPHQWCDRSS